MKIALINIEKFFGAPPIGLSYLASYVRKHGGFNDIKIIDRENIIEAVKSYNPDIIGVGAVSEQFAIAKDLSFELKKFLDCPLILGGVHITIKPNDLLKTAFDIGVMGEGEKIFLNLLNLYKDKLKFDSRSLKKLKGVCYKDGNKLLINPAESLIEDIDSIPYIARDLLKMDNFYLIPGRIGKRIGVRGAIMTSRGCPYHCVYCGSNTLFRKVRWHSVDYVVNEIELLYNKYGVKHITVYDDLSIANIPRFREIVKKLDEKGLNKKIDFEIYARANLINDEMCVLLKKMNAQNVCFGFESGSNKILKYLKKNSATVEQGVNAINLCKKYGLTISGYIMIGNPDETEEDLKMSFDFISNPKVDFVQVYQTTPLPGTELWDYAVKNNKINDDYYDVYHKTILKYNPDTLLTDSVTKEKFGVWYTKFMEMALKKNKGFQSVKITPKDIVDCFSLKFLNKIFKNLNKI